MSDIQKGYAYTTGSPGNQVTADNLNQLVDSAVILPAFITAKTEKTTPDPNDLFPIYDSAGNALAKLRYSNLIQSSGLALFKNLKNVNDAGSPATTVDITADEILLRNNSGAPLYLSNVSVSANITIPAAAGGLDTGSEASLTWYYLYVISDGTNVNGLLSTTNGTPALPGSYAFFGLVGAVYNDTGSNFRNFIQRDHEISQLPDWPVQSTSASANPYPYVSQTIATSVPPNAKSAFGSVISTTSVQCVVAIASDSTGVGEIIISSGSNNLFPSNASPSSETVLIAGGKNSQFSGTGHDTNGNPTGAYAGARWSMVLTTPQTICSRTNSQTNHWAISVAGFTL